MSENVVLCGSNAYVKKYYLNPGFDKLPKKVREELQIMCVKYTEDIGGILTLEFTKEGSLILRSACAEEDKRYKESESEERIKKLREDKKELFTSLELYNRTMKAIR